MKIGDVVKLKSGGPEMTINRFTLFGKRVYCIWWHTSEDFYKAKDYEHTCTNGHYRDKIFSPGALDLIKVAN